MRTFTVPTVELPAGQQIPALGQGTWGLGEDPAYHDDEIAALRTGLDLEMTIIDTAEMYGDGTAEQLVGDAVFDRRDDAFIVTKVLPSHAGRPDTLRACEASLHRLRTDYIDLYLLHWPSPVPLDETVDAFTTLQEQGKIRFWGVSNFDGVDLMELTAVPDGGSVQTDQVLYNLAHRGIEWDLLPACQRGGPLIMAYSPFDHRGTVLRHPTVAAVADRHGVTPAQVAIAWVLRQDGVSTIPKASTPEHTRENHGALAVRLDLEDYAALDRAFPPPDGPRPLEMI
ncbi:aldo/keto reductase [Dactylosporangium fulvum]|uniref:Aldo/keto reductase n=1 Tax=Dactylosporangium fulvum TaxID=53359 RepID=A0ABY5W861_9ACTN|nr:aldo/keto reductase [Dactylosporangium fulvum]UWP86287.1 aldo/keto reductase [Dactylosporangium fulvum]